MKFSKLYLKAFGPYTEHVIDFENETAAFHIVCGPNEAGKSSLLRAIQAFLYGIPFKSQDNFIHENGMLRIGGVIKDGILPSLSVIRRKAKKQALRKWDGEKGLDCEGEALPDNAILEYLGGVEESRFSNLFGIGRKELIDGGKSILEGKGDVGESLFEAGSGLIGLRRLRESLESEASALFAPQGSKPKINAGISEYTETLRLLKSLLIRTEEWSKRSEALNKAKEDHESIKNKIENVRKEKLRCERIIRNLPLIARRGERLKEVVELSEVPLLNPTFTLKRISAGADKKSADHNHKLTSQKLEKLRAEFAEIKVKNEFENYNVLILGAYSRLGVYQRDELDIPGLIAKRQNRIDDAKNKMRELELGVDLVEVERFRPKKNDLKMVRKLVTDKTILDEHKERLEQEEIALQADIERAEHDFSLLKMPPDASRLDEVIQQATLHSDSENKLKELNKELLHREAEVDRKIKALGPRSASELKLLQLPSKATLQRLQLEADAIAKDRILQVAQFDGRKKDLSLLLGKKSNMEAKGVVPSEDELIKARENRDKGWRLIQSGFITKTSDPIELGQGYSPNEGLPEAFESAMKKADSIVDVLRHDTERATEYSSILDRIAEISSAIHEDESKIRELDSRRELWLMEWEKIIVPLGLTIPTIRELEEWLVDLNGVLTLLGEIDNKQKDCEGLEREINNARNLLKNEMVSYGVVEPQENSISILLGRARLLLTKNRQESLGFETSKKRINDLKGNLVAQKIPIQKADANLAEWAKEWISTVSSIGLGNDTSPHEAEERLTLLGNLFDEIDDAKKNSQDLQEKENAVKRYSEEVLNLANVLGINGSSATIGEIATDLYSQYQLAIKNAQHRDRILTQIDAELLALKSIEEKVDSVNTDISELCMAAKVESIDDLPAVEEKSKLKAESLTEISKIEKDLSEQNGLPLDKVIDESDKMDKDTLAVQIQGQDEEIKILESERDAFSKILRDAEVALSEIDGGGKSAEAAQKAQEILSRIKNVAEDYTRLKTSSFVIARAIEAYREKNQGPILKRASEYFGILTCGSYAKLDVDFGEDSAQVLTGIRRNGKKVFVEGMSEGTRDQLYLALRLAAIEHHLDIDTPIPVIVDDILVQFDDERSKAAFKALEMLSSRTQVLLFTHHEHLLPLAHQVTKKGALAVYMIDTRLPFDEREVVSVGVGAEGVKSSV